MVWVTNRRNFSILALASLLSLVVISLFMVNTVTLTGSFDLVANYNLPWWAASAIRVGLNTAGTLGAVIAVLGTFGLGSVAAVAWSLVRKYGVRFAVAW